MHIEFPSGLPGIHPPTSALTKILKFKQVLNPVTEEPFSEALLLGIGGGLDAGYILYQFNHLPNPILVLGFRYNWNQTQVLLENLADRLHLDVQFQTFDSSSTAQRALQNAIKRNKPAIVWVDKAKLPYHLTSERMQGQQIKHQVAVYARDGRLWRLYLDDLCSQPIEVREKTFTASRASLSQSNFLMMVFNRSNEINIQDLREALLQGMQDCATQMTRPIKTIGVSNLENWADKLTNYHDHAGWPLVFKDQKDLFPALRRIYEAIKLDGTDGYALRKLYSDFLHESSGILNNPALNAVAGQYLQLSNHWSNLAENALPSRILVFDRFKNLLNKKYLAYKKQDLQVYEKCHKDLQALEKKIIADFPMKANEVDPLFTRLSSQVQLIAELELSAALRLRDITRR